MEAGSSSSSTPSINPTESAVLVSSAASRSKRGLSIEIGQANNPEKKKKLKTLVSKDESLETERLKDQKSLSPRFSLASPPSIVFLNTSEHADQKSSTNENLYLANQSTTRNINLPALTTNEENFDSIVHVPSDVVFDVKDMHFSSTAGSFPRSQKSLSSSSAGGSNNFNPRLTSQSDVFNPATFGTKKYLDRIRELTVDLERVQLRLEERTKMVRSIQKERNQLRISNESLRNREATQKSEFSDFVAKNRALQQQIIDLKKSMSANLSIQSDMTDNQTSGKNDQIAEQLFKAEHKIASLQNEMKFIRQQYQNASARASELVLENDALIGQNVILQAKASSEAVNLREDLIDDREARFRSEIKNLKNELKSCESLLAKSKKN